MTIAAPNAFSQTREWMVSSPLSLEDTMSGRLVERQSPIPVSTVRGDDWANEVDIEIKELLLLEEGWDGGVAAPVHLTAMALARELASQAAAAIPGLARPCVTPAVDGSVVLEWHRSDAQIEITFADASVGIFFQVEALGEEWEGDFEDAPIDPATFLYRHFR